MDELFALFAAVTEQYIDISRDGGTVIDAIADVIADYDVGYTVLTNEAYAAFVDGLTRQVSPSVSVSSEGMVNVMTGEEFNIGGEE